jgi:hypothetical protein
LGAVPIKVLGVDLVDRVGGDILLRS